MKIKYNSVVRKQLIFTHMLPCNCILIYILYKYVLFWTFVFLYEILALITLINGVCDFYHSKKRLFACLLIHMYTCICILGCLLFLKLIFFLSTAPAVWIFALRKLSNVSKWFFLCFALKCLSPKQIKL